MQASKATRTVEAILGCLVADDIEGMLRIASGSRVTAEEVRAAIDEYGRTPVMPAAPLGGLLNAVEVRGANPRSWSVYVPLWTKEEGRSDLTLLMRLTDTEGELYAWK